MAFKDLSLSHTVFAISAGAAAGTLAILIDHGIDVLEPDEETTWFLGWFHVPTLMVGLGAVVALTFVWAAKYTDGLTVVYAAIGAASALVSAFITSLFLPLWDGLLALLGLG